VDADVHGLNADSVYESLAKRYRGYIAYDDGHMRYGQYATLPHSFRARFSATPSQFVLDSADMKISSSTAHLHAVVDDYSNPSVSGDYQVQLHTPDFSSMAGSLRPAGDVVLSGSIHYRNQPDVPWLRNVFVDGQVESHELTATTEQAQVDLRNIAGTYKLENASFVLPDLIAQSLGGKVKVSVNMQHLDSTPVSHVDGALRDISLGALRGLTHPSGMKRIALAGTLNGGVAMSWTGPVSNLQARADLTVRAEASARHSPTQVPVDGVIHATYDAPQQRLAVHQTFLRIPSTTLNAEGEVSRGSQLQLVLASSDLRQLEMLMAAFSPNTRMPALSGSANMNTTVQGSMQRPQIAGQFVAHNLVVQGGAWRTAQVSFQASPSRVTLSNGLLENARRGRAAFAGRIDLRNWSYLPQNSIAANLSVQQMSLTDIERLADVSYPISGELSGNITLSGSQLNPMGHGNLQVRNAVAYDQPIQTLTADFRAAEKSISSDLNVATSAGSAKVALTYSPLTTGYQVRLDAPHIDLQQLHAVKAKGLPLHGVVTISAAGQGTIDNPQLTASILLPKLDLQQQSISGVSAQLKVANKSADLTFDALVDQAPVHGGARVALTDDYPVDASLDTSPIPLNVLLSTYTQVPEGFQGKAELHARLKGPLKQPRNLEAHVTIPTLNVGYQSLQIGAASPIQADFVHSILTLQPADIRGTETALHIQGSVPIGTDAPSTLSVKGSVDAGILRIAFPDVRSSGTVLLDVSSSGKIGSQIQGQIKLQNIAVTTPDAPIGVEKMNGAINIDKQGLHTADISAEVGGGKVAARGNISFTSGYRFDMSLQASSVRLRYPQGLRTLLDTNLNWTGDRSASVLSGRVLINSLAFTPEFDVANLSSEFGGNVEVPAEPGFADTIQLQIAVQSRGDLTATSSQVSLQGAADLQVSGSAQDPVVTGRTNLSSGELFFRGQRYQLKRGIITFDNPNQTRPVLNMTVGTTVEQYNLTVMLTGPLDMLTTAYTSDPPLATADIINLIARGQTTSESAASATSSDSILASQAAGQVSGSVQQLAGISSLQIDPLFGANNQDPSARVGIQQRVSKNFLFTFSTDVTQPGSEIVQGDYQINRRWSVSVARDQLGGVSVDGRFHTQF